jgi:lipoyl(octanoyl) transferase
MTRWRLIVTPPLAGALNMAVDEALLDCFDPAEDRPVFRLYGWEPPALSLGRFQKAHEVLDRERCLREKVPVVRRITGGGMIYHCEELTYSLVCAQHQIPPAGSVKDAFRVLTAFLIRFYEKLGLAPCYAADHLPAGTRLGERTPFCFAGKESYDILVEGKKVGGNAQRRQRNAIFQHGSIPLVNRADRGAGFLRHPPVGVGETTAALGDLGVGLDREELQKLMAGAFAEALPAALTEDSLTAVEKGRAATLALQKHSTAAWVWEGLGKEHEDHPQA